MKYRKRWIAGTLRAAVEQQQVIVLTGARQVGKSTLLRKEQPFAGWKYVSMDDFDALAAAREDAASLWAGTDRIIIDEVQKAPQVLERIKIAVDEHPGRYRFILSGSANLLLMNRVSESLAGRAAYFNLYPLCIGEKKNHAVPDLLARLFKGELPEERTVRGVMSDPLASAWKGFMPSLLETDDTDQIVRWWEGYVATYLERDLRQLSQIESLPDFRKLMAALALRCGGLLNQSGIARETGISQPSVNRYIGLLETTCLLERLPAYAVNRTKRLVKTPRVMWLDSGLASFLAGYYAPDDLHGAREAGGLFEAAAYLHLKALGQQLTPRPHFHYWRTATGTEVDFVLEQGRSLVGIEIKLSGSVGYADAKGLKVFVEEYPGAVGMVLYTGREVRRLGERIVAVPWQVVAG